MRSQLNVLKRRSHTKQHEGDSQLEGVVEAGALSLVITTPTGLPSHGLRIDITCHSLIT